MPDTPDPSTPRQVAARATLRAAIRSSGMPAEQYARRILIRDDRLVRRWLAGETAIPEAVITFLDPEMQSHQG